MITFDETMSGKTEIQIKRLLKEAASRSPGRFRVGGIALNKKGEILGVAHNSFRKDNVVGERKGTGEHCEVRLIRRYRGNIKTLILIRIGNSGDILPIDPCPSCQALCDKYGITVLTINGSRTKEL